jgi:hypothetical protein
LLFALGITERGITERPDPVTARLPCPKYTSVTSP